MFTTAPRVVANRVVFKHRTLQNSTLRSVLSLLRTNRPPTARLTSTSLSMSSTDLNSDDARPFNQSTTTVQIKETEGGQSFLCDEEPHMLSPEHGYGYYPFTLGDKLREGKLEIVRKLGWGAYSSVWLARVLDDSPTTRYVAVKVLTVNATAGVLNGFLAEVDSLKRVASANPHHPGYKYCVHLQDSFIGRSHHGPHLCLLTDVLGSDMNHFRRSQPNKVFPVPLTKRIVKQTLLALDYLHTQSGLIHTDVKPENILVYVDQSDAAITQYLKECPSVAYEPRVEPDLSPDPIITVVSQPLPNIGLKPDASNLKICLSDLGHSTPVDKHLTEDVQPVLLRAPEVNLGHLWSTSIDVWSVGCLSFEYLTGAALFELYESSSVSFQDVHLERIVEFLGPFPPKFLAECKLRAQYFDEQGSLLRIKKYFPRTIDECIRNYKHVEEKDIPDAARFIRRCLTIDPSERPSASELLDDEWLKDI